MTNWRDKTCETCKYQVQLKCRMQPQSLTVWDGFAYFPACRAYEELQQTPVVEGSTGKVIGHVIKPRCPCNQPTATDISGTPYCVACGAKH